MKNINGDIRIDTNPNFAQARMIIESVIKADIKLGRGCEAHLAVLLKQLASEWSLDIDALKQYL